MSGNPGARWPAFWWIAGAAFVLVIGLFLSWCYWEELRGKHESLSTTVRNVGLMIGGAEAILFAVWRSIVAEKQAKTAQLGLLNERYQKGAEMLDSGGLSGRIGGIYALAGLGREDPENYHTKIMRLLCGFVRHPLGDAVEAALPTKGLTPAAEFASGQDEAADEVGAARSLRVREDVQAVMTEIGKRSEFQIKTEDREEYRLDLREAKLKSVHLSNADLNRVNLSDADLTNALLICTNLKGAYLKSANLENASLVGANLQDVRLPNVNLEGAWMIGTNLTRTVMTTCKGLTQEQLDEALVEPGNPPELGNLVDAKTGEPLVWRGRSFPEGR